MPLLLSSAEQLTVSPLSAGRRRGPSALVLAVLLAACANAADTAPTVARDVDSIGVAQHPVDRIVTLTTADGTRSAVVHHPASAGPGAPLVVVLHPAATPASAMQAGFGWDRVADREGFVVAYPNGLLDLYQDTWNGGACCPPASELGTDDVGFLEVLVEGLRRYDDVGRRIYAVGFSNGAMMAYAWACRRPGRLTGIGAVAGAVMTGCTDPAAMDVVAVHGTADPRIPADGGPGPDGSTFPTVDASLAPFRQAARCADPADHTSDATAEVTTWSCANGRRIVLAMVTGGGHSWPGAGPAAGSAIDPGDATGFVWAQLRSAG
jgi:polyhydroxybutyrate depolymerase